MHELSIAGAVIEIVERHAAGRRVKRVELRVGHLRQVVPSALEFAFELVAQGTVADGAELAMEEVPADVRCTGCGTDSVLRAFPARCASCGSVDVEVAGGEELLVDALELEDEEAALTRSGG
jgi:hydrogenase nickel incorporation protein HypA/HybF